MVLVSLAVLKLIAVTSAETDDITKLKNLTKALAYQVMMQQFYIDEDKRSSGQSGIKQKRVRFTGNKAYHADTFSHQNFAQMHDHADHRTTVGSGELIAVLNGVEFRTRHNDFALRQPSRTSREFHKSDLIDLPEVPPEVLEKATVDEQTIEMREWFKAWRDQDHSVRDYRKYFKPVLCYLEGAWTLPKHDEIDEPFESDRHFIESIDWDELHRTVRYLSNIGSKHNDENAAFLPTAIVDMVNDEEPVFAQWNYRIMCHPLQKYVYLNRLRVIDDLAPRVAFGNKRDSFNMNRAARFELNAKDSGEFSDSHVHDRKFIDDLMEEIPGKDNYGQYLTDHTFDKDVKRDNDSSKLLNVAYYHRRYQVTQVGADGRQYRDRGFADNTVYVAMNTQEKIVTQKTNDKCFKNPNNVKNCRKSYEAKVSYAIPFEIIYLTPLGSWNPYNIEYNETGEQCETCSGGREPDTAYSHASGKYFYQTPASFFTGATSAGDAADTSGRSVGMLDREGNVRVVRASGVYCGIPEIADVGVLRTRYPIAPIHQEGNTIWKELQALKDMLLAQGSKFQALREDYGATTVTEIDSGPSVPDLVVEMQVAPTNADLGTSEHTHLVTLTHDDVTALQNGKDVMTVSSFANGHTHELQMRYNTTRISPYFYARCDGNSKCWDGHTKYMIMDKPETFGKH